jgi:hypothetical protein
MKKTCTLNRTKSFFGAALLGGGLVLTFVVWFQMRQTQAQSAANTAKQPASLPAVPQEQRLLLSNDRVFNAEAAVPPQCYTKTHGQHNPCYTCHQVYDRTLRDRLNQLDDGGLQGSYAFSDVGMENHYTNLFVDRKSWVKSISDATIDAYVAEDNYSALSDHLKKTGWQGYLPDLKNYQDGKLAFDEHGLARDGSAWVAFNYKPFPGTFWPTNGSTDDVVVRLPSAFRNLSGTFHRDTYYINLSLVELALKGLPSLTLWEVDERELGVDLNGDGTLSKTSEVHLLKHYVGDAKDVAIDFEQFPEGSELMHSVRYLGLDKNGRVIIPKRMKELRYMKKVNVLSRELLRSRYDGERKEKRLGELPSYLARADQGLDNALGWFIKGFIEDYDGELRTQTLEEDMYCLGCHKAIATTIDTTFSFPRKVPGGAGWGYINLAGMRDAPNLNEAGGEILNYLRRVGGGSEFRANSEMRERWFDEQGKVREAQVRAADVATLILPSAQRARSLNKAYTEIVRHQSYRLGRDATLEPTENVFVTIDQDVEPLSVDHRHFGWDLRLDWDKH